MIDSDAILHGIHRAFPAYISTSAGVLVAYRVALVRFSFNLSWHFAIPPSSSKVSLSDDFVSAQYGTHQSRPSSIAEEARFL